MQGQRNDERRAVVFWVGGSFVAVIAISIATASWLQGYSHRPPLQGAAVVEQVQRFPTPRLQHRPRQDLHTVQHARTSLIDGYAWIDRARGRCRVPIDVAMNLLLQSGFQLQQ